MTTVSDEFNIGRGFSGKERGMRAKTIGITKNKNGSETRVVQFERTTSGGKKNYA